MANPNVDNLARLGRLDLRFAFTKIALWKQEQFRKIVYIDADVVALRAPDELFELAHAFAAAPDIGWPDIFNSGVMLLTPNEGDHRSLFTLAASGASLDGADQGLFNEYFANRPWRRISFTYNCTPNASYQYEPAYRHYQSSIKLVHFIGRNKPWQQGRRALSSVASGVYKELVGRWWTVYDRHYNGRRSSALGQVATTDYHLQQFVRDEDSNSAITWAAGGNMPADGSQLKTKSDSGFKPEQGESQAQFVPPQMSWDATRSAPPATSGAEAGSFPSQKYEMSSSTGLFHAPTSYPEPPREANYAMPPRTPPADKPPPIFPWEQHAQRPTRVFADRPQPQTSASSAESSAGAGSDIPISANAGAKPLEKTTPSNDTIDSFSRTNAWDGNNAIDQYVRAVRETQTKRGGVQVLQQDERDNILSSTGEEDVTSPGSKQRRRPRQGSLVLTDFPTEDERPSLPVTPLPRGRSFWGGERDEEGELPAAEGVPDQKDWDPHEQLEKLRRSSLLAAEELPRQDSANKPPLRAVPETSSDIPAPSIENETLPIAKDSQKTSTDHSLEAKQ